MLIGAGYRGEGRINSFTVQYLVSITSPKGKKQANSRYAERENYMERLFFFSMYTSGDTEKLNLQHWVRNEATRSHSVCVLSHNNKSLEMW